MFCARVETKTRDAVRILTTWLYLLLFKLVRQHPTDSSSAHHGLTHLMLQVPASQFFAINLLLPSRHSIREVGSAAHWGGD